MRITHKILLTALLLFIGFASGIAFQKYYTIDRFFRDIGLRNLSDYQKLGRLQLPLSLLNGKKLMVALAFGQSNSANYSTNFELTRLTNRRILNQVPHPARAGTGAKPAADTKIFIHHILIFSAFQLGLADRMLGTDRHAYSAIPTGAAG